MPSIVYIYPPHSPVRRMPKSVQMSIVTPSPWACNKCNKTTITYADEVVWCLYCEKKLLDADKHDISRGEQENTPPLSWKRLEV